MTLPTILVRTAGICTVVGVYRLLAGPTRTDRLVGLDLLFALALVLCMLAARVSRRAVYLDVATGLALGGCVATLAWARQGNRGYDFSRLNRLPKSMQSVA